MTSDPFGATTNQTNPQNVEWADVRVPGVPSGYQYFLLEPSKQVSRLSFEPHKPILFTGDEFICFDMRSPNSQHMFPNISLGDFGFPTINLTNTAGTSYLFARGNMKDFFDIQHPNDRQSLRIPVQSFIHNFYLANNPESQHSFFDLPVTSISFDFLPHFEHQIDIEFGNLHFESPDTEAKGVFEEIVNLSKTEQHTGSLLLATESGAFHLQAQLANHLAAEQYLNKPMYWVVFQSDRVICKGHLFLRPEAQVFTFDLPDKGMYELKLRVEANGKSVAESRRTMASMDKKVEIPRKTILGISDEIAYQEIAALGGSWARLPVLLNRIEPSGDGFRFTDTFNWPEFNKEGNNVLSVYAMPTWLSRHSDRVDAARYAPSDWVRYAELLKWLVEAGYHNGITHVEVWNEASVIGHWDDTMDNLIKLHEVSYTTIKSISTSITVLGGCTHTWNFDFLRNFLAAGGAQYCDSLALHGYTYEPNAYLLQFDELDELLSQASGALDSAHITEMGFRVPAFTARAQAIYLALYTLEAASRANIDSLLWFRYQNTKSENPDAYDQTRSTGYAMTGHKGLYVRPSYPMYRLLHNLLTQCDQVSSAGDWATRTFTLSNQGVPMFQAEFNLEQLSLQVSTDNGQQLASF